MQKLNLFRLRQTSRAPGFSDTLHMKEARLSALLTGLLYPLRDDFRYSFVLETELTLEP
jgi:hypothetical protein